MILLYDNATLVLEPGSLITEYVGNASVNDQPILIEYDYRQKTRSQVHIKGGSITNCTFYIEKPGEITNTLIRVRNDIDQLETDVIYKAPGPILHLSGNTNNYVGRYLKGAYEDFSWWYDLDTTEEIRVPAQE